MKRLALLAVIVLVGGAVAADTYVPERRALPRGARVASAGGVYACPFAVEQTGSGYLHLANIGPASAAVRVTLLPSRGRGAVLPITMGAGRARTIRLHGRLRFPPAGALVQYAGGPVVASHTVWLSPRSGPSGAASASCARTAGSVLVAGPGRTLAAKTTLAMVNPGSANADVTVEILADDRLIRPERLEHRIVPPRSRVDVDLGDFAFDARSVFAVIRANAGRVVAETLVSSPRGIAIAAARAPATGIVAPSGASGGSAVFSVAPVGSSETGVEARLVNDIEQGTAPRVPPLLAPEEILRLAIPSRNEGRAVAYTLSAQAGSPLSAGASWDIIRGSAGRDELVLEAEAPARRWGGVVGIDAPVGRARALIANPGPDHVRATVRTFGRSPSEETITIPPGRLRAIALGTSPGPHAIEVVADGGVVVVIDALARSRSQRVFAYALSATPIAPAAEVTVGRAPRVGVPAPVGGQ